MAGLEVGIFSLFAFLWLFPLLLLGYDALRRRSSPYSQPAQSQSAQDASRYYAPSAILLSSSQRSS
jgi:hypothetical protein